MGKKDAKHKGKSDIKSIADLLGTASSADPSLEALFKQNVYKLQEVLITDWTIETIEKSHSS